MLFNKCPEPTCMLAHHLMNKLSIIVGYCEMMSDEAQEGSELAKRLRVMHDGATEMAKELGEHPCLTSETQIQNR